MERDSLRVTIAQLRAEVKLLTMEASAPQLSAATNRKQVFVKASNGKIITMEVVGVSD